jgi:Zn-dependent protease
MIVAAAGPVSNMLMALGLFICLMLMKSFSETGGQLVRYVVLIGLPEQGGSVLAPLTVLAYEMIRINVLLAIFNLIPVAPLDGAAVLEGVLPRSLSAPFAELQRHGIMILVLLIFLNVPSMMFSPVIHVVNSFLTL